MATTVTGGNFTVSGNMSFGGNLTINNGGRVAVGEDLSPIWRSYPTDVLAPGRIPLDTGGTLQIGMGNSTGTLRSDLVNNGTLVFKRSGSYTHSHVISGNGSLVKDGVGTVVLAADNTCVGSTTINAGVVTVTFPFRGLGQGIAVATGAELALAVRAEPR